MKFSQRTAWRDSDSAYAAAVARARAAGKPPAGALPEPPAHALSGPLDLLNFVDLTVANPAACGLAMDAARILTPLASDRNLVYEPHPLGIPRTREAVAAYYAARSCVVSPESILLTASTSEAYSYLLQLVCDVGDEVLIAAPGYPLLDVLADLNDVALAHYPLFYDHGWHIDRAALTAALSSRTRAIVLIHPNNPTGHYTRDQDRFFLEQTCAAQQIALIVDEVFLDYAIELENKKQPKSFAGTGRGPLTCVLSGMSKIAALPQMKVAWLTVHGADSEEAQAKLEIIADSYLSVGGPAQNALPDWLAASDALQSAICERVWTNLKRLDELLRAQRLVTRLAVEGGWCAILRLPDISRTEEPALELLESHRVLVQPGHLFAIAGNGHLVVSLLPETAIFSEGIRRILEFADELEAHTQR